MKPIHLEPQLENNGTRYGWRLVIEFDPDWQDAYLELGSMGGTFSVHVPDEMVAGMKIPQFTAEARS